MSPPPISNFRENPRAGIFFSRRDRHRPQLFDRHSREVLLRSGPFLFGDEVQVLLFVFLAGAIGREREME